MSASLAMIKFKKTGNIYFGCYEGTSDLLLPYICTPEECYNEKHDCYCALTYCRELFNRNLHNSWIISDDTSDVDEVEIYSDYGGGFYWSSIGSESLKKINGGDPWEYGDVTDGVPDWVKEFWEKNDEN